MEIVDLENRKKSGSTSEFNTSPSVTQLLTRKNFDLPHEGINIMKESRLDNNIFHNSQVLFDRKSSKGLV